MVTTLMFTGCGSSIPNLSKLDNSKASEYMAGELMKKDDNYQYGLDYDRSLLEPTPVPTIAPTPVPSNAPADDKSGKSTSQGGGSEAPAMQEVSVSDVYGLKGVEVKLVSSSLKDSFGEEYTILTASKGKKLMVLYFKVKNSSGKDQTVNFKTINPEYYLLQNGARVGNPQKTIADGDIQFFKGKIKSGKSKQAILVFEVDKEFSMDNVSLAISKDGKQATVALK